MNLKIITEDGNKHCLTGVRAVYNIKEGLTQHEELKNTLLVVHNVSHSEQFRLYKNAHVLQIEE